MDSNTLKERIQRLSLDEREQLKQYVEAIKEIKKGIKELLSKGQMEEGGNRSTDLYINPEE